MQTNLLESKIKTENNTEMDINPFRDAFARMFSW
jgi:hypothetical protein